MAKDLPNQTVYEDEKSRLLQDETYQGSFIDQSAWDLDRSTPVGTLKSLIRSINTHNISTDHRQSSCATSRKSNKVFIRVCKWRRQFKFSNG